MSRAIINTNYSKRTELDYLLTEFFGKILQENGDGILLERSVNNIYIGRNIPTTNYS